MVINGDWKNKVRTMRANKDHAGAKRELRKAKMSMGYRNATDKNKIFVDYCLAYYSYIEKDFDLANKYLSYIEDIFNKDFRNAYDMSLEYCNYLWLSTNLNHKKMSLDDICKNMSVIYEYYFSIEKYDIAISAMANIYEYKGDGEKLLEKLDELLRCPQISDYNFIDSFLRSCDNMSHNLYIKAMNIVNKYEINIDVV